MSIRGPEALASLDEAMRDIRREEDEISKRLARSAERVSKIREGEAELFRQLAQLRLDPSVQSELDGRISQAEIKARDLLKSHATTLSSTEKALADIDGELSGLTSARAEALKALDTQQGALKALTTRMAETIAKDPALVAKQAEAKELADVAAQSMRKTEQAETDREQKGRPYRDDPLFMYLWDNGFGTSAYKAGNLVRYLDNLVANLVGFLKARPNYAMLNEIPLRLREHAERQIANANAARAELETLETQAVDAAGGKPIREAMSAAQKKIEDIDAQITAVEDRRDETAKSLGTLAQGGDPAFESALAALIAELGREDIQTLLAEARRTRTGQDDTIVAQIDDARSRVKDEDTETREQKERLKTLAARRRELEDIQWEFKKQRFDDPRSSFKEERLVGDLLNDFLRGGISAASYWDQWRRSQNWSEGSSEWGGGFGLPDNGRSSNNSGGSGFDWPDWGSSSSSNSSRGNSGGFGGSWGKSSSSSGSSSGGGFSRPRSGSSGTRKSSGFKTGGGF